MELKNKYAIIVSAVFAACMLLLHFLLRKKRRPYKGGTRIYGMAFLKDTPYLGRKKMWFRIWTCMMLFALSVSIVAAGVLVARPYRSKAYKEDVYSRDIMLCMDISTTVDAMNQSLVDELIATVDSMHGERFGIIIFNTSPVLLCPLTDDYEFVIEQLKNISKALDLRIRAEEWGVWDEDYYYWNQYISAGTLIGNVERGSSIIGDGLASTVYHFSNDDKDRTRIVIFTTDNDVLGKEIFDLPEAAELCRQNDIIVFGIGTNEMRKADMEEMKYSVELTGGSFYLEEDKGTFTDIVADIQAQSASLIGGKTYFVETEYPRLAFLVLLGGVTVFFMTMRILRK